MLAARRTSGLGRSSSSPPPNIPDHSAMLAMKEMAVAMAAATEPMRMSRCLTCMSSWAITPSSSSLGIWRSRPTVAQTTACLGLRPVAKALGCSLGDTATCGMGRPARSASERTRP